jgi:hypothetical protein
MSKINITPNDYSLTADETNHYSDCSETSTIPLECTPKHSTRALIQFWNTPHESGTTLSFTYNDKDSTDTDNVDRSGGIVHDSSNSLLSISESCSTRPQNTSNDKDSLETDNFNCSGDSIRDSISSQQSLAESINALRHKATLLEVSVDEDRNDETGTSMYSLDISASSHPSNNNIEIGICPLVDLTGKRLTNSDIDIDVGLLDRLEDEHLLTSPSEEPAIALLAEQSEPTPANGLPVENGAHFGVSDTKLSNRLPPLAPSPRRPFKRVHETHTVSRDKTPLLPPVDKLSTTNSTEVLTPPCFTGESKDEELHTLSMDGKSLQLTTGTVVPFSPESAVPPDDDLDLTSIHSEDSDGGVLCNTRDHMIDVDSHVLLHDISVLIPSPLSDDKSKEQFDEKSTSSSENNDRLDETLDIESSREHNQSNDTERMILNVMDAAEKAMQVDGNRQNEYQLSPSAFFDCNEYGPEYNRYESALLLDPVSPKPVTEQDVVERETPLRSNSGRTESLSGISNLVDVMASTKSTGIPRERLLPKRKASKSRIKIEKEMKPKNRKLQGPTHSLHLALNPGDADDEDLENSSVSTLDIDSDKEADTSDLFWIDAFLDFVSPLEDSRSLDSDSSSSSASESHRIHMSNTGASVVTDATSGKKTLRQKRKTQTSLSRLREWWQKELVSEVLRGNLVNPSPDGDTDSVDHHATFESLEKIVSHEFHKVLSGKKVALLSSGVNGERRKEKSTYSQPQDWLELFVAAVESAKNGNLGCGVVETVVEAYGPTPKDATSTETRKAPLDMSFDSLDGLVQKLKKEKNRSGSNGLSGKFQSLYHQLQQKLEDANLFDLGVAKSQFAASEPKASKSQVASKDIVDNGDETNAVVEVFPDDSLKYLLNPNPTSGDNGESKTIPDSKEIQNSPIYSSPPVDGDFQTSVLSTKSSSKSPRFAIKSYARAKAALALRRKASALRNTEMENEILSTSTEFPVAERDYSLECQMSPFQNLDRLGLSVYHNESSVSHQIKVSDDPALCDFSNDNNFDISYFQKEFNFSESQFKDSDDKNNITKETVTDHSCTEDSLAIRSALEHVTLSRAHGSALCGFIDAHEQQKHIDIAVTTMPENNFCDDSPEQSRLTRTYDPLNNSETDDLSAFFRENSGSLDIHFDGTAFGEGDYEELLSMAEGLPSAELISGTGMKIASATNRVGHRSLVSKRGTLAKLGNVSTSRNITGLKSKVRRHAERLMSSASRPIMSSVSTQKSLHMPFSDQEEKKDDCSFKSDPPEAFSIDVLDERPRSSINDTPFLSSFRQKARRIRRQKCQGKYTLEKQSDPREKDIDKAGNNFSFSDQVNSKEWEDFTSSGPFSLWTK